MTDNPKTDKEKNNNKLHLIIISVLLIVFFIILLLSTLDSNLETNYKFSDNVNISSEKSSQIKIGEVTIKNSGLLTTRASLNNYVGCNFESDSSYRRGYEVEYTGARTVSGKTDIFSYSRYNNKIDISRGDEVKLNIYLKAYSLFPDKENYNSNDKQKKIHIYLQNGEEGYYSYCENVRPEDALRVITINANYENSADNLQERHIYKN